MTWQKDRVFNSGDDFIAWLRTAYPNTVKNNISQVHMHHTWSPNHSNNQSTLQLHKNMRNYHMNTNGWGDIAQHVSIGKDGKVVLGRSITLRPISASYYNGSQNWHPFMFETIGNFDVGHDKLHGVQLASVLAILHFFHVVSGKPIKFHREMSSKTCPGSGLDKAKITAQAKAYKKGSSGHDVAVANPTPQPTVPVVSNSNSIRDYLDGLGWDGSFANRAKLAKEHGIKNYTGTAEQNLALLAMLKAEQGKNKKKSLAVIAQEVIDGKWGNNPARKRDLESAGYNYTDVQNAVNNLLAGNKPVPSAPAKKSNTQIAQEVIDGVWGNNPERARKLREAGYDANAIQNEVNKLASGKAPSKPASSAIKVGSRVTLSNSATHYATGEKIPASVKGKTYTVMQLGSGKALLKEIMSWVNLQDIGGSGKAPSAPTPSAPKKKQVKAGDTVTAKALYVNNSSTKNVRLTNITGYVDAVNHGWRNQIRLRNKRGGYYLGFTRVEDLV